MVLGGVCLCELLGRLGSSLLLFTGGERLGSSGGSCLWSLSLLDLVERGTDDGSLDLDSLSGSLLGSLLGDSLLVSSSEQDGP